MASMGRASREKKGHKARGVRATASDEESHIEVNELYERLKVKQSQETMSLLAAESPSPSLMPNGQPQPQLWGVQPIAAARGPPIGSWQGQPMAAPIASVQGQAVSTGSWQGQTVSAGMWQEQAASVGNWQGKVMSATSPSGQMTFTQPAQEYDVVTVSANGGVQVRPLS